MQPYKANDPDRYYNNNNYNNNNYNNNNYNNNNYNNNNNYYNNDARFISQEEERYRIEEEKRIIYESEKLRLLLNDIDQKSSAECTLNVAAQWSFETNVNEITQIDAVCVL